MDQFSNKTLWQSMLINQTSDSDEFINLGSDFDFDGFQVVRKEFFAHQLEPSVTFNNCKFNVNLACLNKFPNTSSVQVLVNQEKKIMALLPCPDGARDSFAWCLTSSNGKRKPRTLTCKLFFAKMVDLMNWNPDYKYKLIGKLIQANGTMLIAFDLTATETYKRTITEGEKVKTSRVPVFPLEWQDQFGLSYNEHQQAMHIDIFDGYAVYTVKESKASRSVSNSADGILASEAST